MFEAKPVKFCTGMVHAIVDVAGNFAESQTFKKPMLVLSSGLRRFFNRGRGSNGSAFADDMTVENLRTDTLQSVAYKPNKTLVHDTKLSLGPDYHHIVVAGGVLENSFRVARSEDTGESGAWRIFYNDGTLQMPDELGTVVSRENLQELLKECIVKKDLILGRRIHALAKRNGLELHKVVGNRLIRMYASCGSLHDAHQLFKRLPAPDVCAWVSMMSAHVEHGQAEQAMKLYRQLRKSAVELNDYVFVAVLKACGSARNLRCGKLVHADVRTQGFESNIYVANSLVNMYVKCGSLTDARSVFNSLQTRDVVTWNVMIGGYVQHGLSPEALELYLLMQQVNVVPDKVTIVGALKACGKTGSLKDGKQIHAQILERGLEAHSCLSNTLIDMYSKCGSLLDARNVFDGLKRKDVVSWNAMIASYAQHDLGQESLDLYGSMQQNGVVADNVTYVSVLKACKGMRDLQAGKKIHARILETGHQADVFVENTLVHLYAQCGSLVDARGIFDGLSRKDIVTWNVMIAGYAEAGLGEKAFDLYESMHKVGIVPNNATLVNILKACGSMNGINEGRQIHDEVRTMGLEDDIYIATALVDMYAKCGSLVEARKLFDRLPCKEVVTWSAMIDGYSLNGHGEEALKLFERMLQVSVTPDEAVFMSILKVCGSMGLLQEGKRVHSQILEWGFDRDVFICNALVDMYVKCGSLDNARSAFDRLPSRDLVSWTIMISGYAQHGLGQEALDLYASMQVRGLVADKVLFVGILKACGSLEAIQEGKRIHAQIVKMGLEADPFVASALLDMYAKCRRLEDARQVFDGLTRRDVVTWSAMIAGYAKQGLGQEALDLYARMQQHGLVAANRVTFLCLLQACGTIGALQEGEHIHTQIKDSGLEPDIAVGNSLVDMYVKCGSVEDARKVFDSLHSRDVVTWTTLIGGYVQHGLSKDALQVFEDMQKEGVASSEVTFTCVLKACGMSGAMLDGRQIHVQIVQMGLESDLCVGNALVDMYARWGCLDEAQAVFDRMSTRNVVTWTSLINGYGQHNNCRKAVQCFDEMKEQGVEPNATTFTALLVACSHVGLVDTGLHYLKEMADEHGTIVAAEHYTSVADLLGRSGRLAEAEDLLLTMPFEQDRVGWMSLLTACKTHGNVDLGRRCFDRLLQLGISEASGYVLMSNIYTNAGREQDGADIESMRRSAGFSKKAAVATIEVNSKVHEFVVGGKRDDTSVKLKNLNRQAEQDGTVRSTLATASSDNLCAHAEKLALAFGLLNTPEGMTLLINKNLRMCNNCHSGTKMVSKLEKREIIVRDAHRVHHFVDGSCSCGDHF